MPPERRSPAAAPVPAARRPPEVTCPSAPAGQPALAPLAAPAASLTDQAVAAIREAVSAGALQPGRLYSAYQVAAMLGVSRSPVREALMRLAEAGMVSFERNRGFRVVVPGPADIADIFQLRLLLEVPAARQAAQRAGAGAGAGLAAALRAELAAMRTAAKERDETLFVRHDQRLHRLILAESGNARMVSLVANLRDVTRLLGASTVGASRGLDEIAEEHEPVVEAIAAGAVEEAGQAMTRHISRTGKLLIMQAVAETGGGPDADGLWGKLSPA